VQTRNMMRMVCLIIVLGLALPGLQAEIHKKRDNVVTKTAHVATAAGQGPAGSGQ